MRSTKDVVVNHIAKMLQQNILLVDQVELSEEVGQG